MFPNICDYNKTERVRRLNKDLDNIDRAGVYLSNIPAGSGYKNPIHFLQTFTSSSFQRYDHGYHENYNRYGWIHPPQYNVSNIEYPVALQYGALDTTAPASNVVWLK